jgi:hypothetical protein
MKLGMIELISRIKQPIFLSRRDRITQLGSASVFRTFPFSSLSTITLKHHGTIIADFTGCR